MERVASIFEKLTSSNGRTFSDGEPDGLPRLLTIFAIAALLLLNHFLPVRGRLHVAFLKKQAVEASARVRRQQVRSHLLVHFVEGDRVLGHIVGRHPRVLGAHKKLLLGASGEVGRIHEPLSLNALVPLALNLNAFLALAIADIALNLELRSFERKQKSIERCKSDLGKCRPCGR